MTMQHAEIAGDSGRDEKKAITKVMAMSSMFKRESRFLERLRIDRADYSPAASHALGYGRA
ncbi:MAG: hypothetical protein CVU60_03310 [Deltaproteobacteria bacterium HGW-Deltaproteobacteria-18]|nr:MAG: hypothetical protein CVU60_03310 [Deltaproteobacteria bacterium HGW-Deltaproteobacteria-18]